MIEHIWNEETEECSCGCGPYDDTVCLREGCPHCQAAQKVQGTIPNAAPIS